MKFTLDDSDDISRSWLNERYCISIQKTVGERSDTYVVFVAVSDEKDGTYDPIYPRFEGHGLRNMGPVAETLVREMAKMKDDTPVSKIEKLLGHVSLRLHQAYARMKAGDPTGFAELGLDPDTSKPTPGSVLYGGNG